MKYEKPTKINILRIAKEMVALSKKNNSTDSTEPKSRESTLKERTIAHSIIGRIASDDPSFDGISSTFNILEGELLPKAKPEIKQNSKNRQTKVKSDIYINVDEPIKLTVTASAEDWLKLDSYILSDSDWFAYSFFSRFVFEARQKINAPNPKGYAKEEVRVLKVLSHLLYSALSYWFKKNRQEWPHCLKLIEIKDQDSKVFEDSKGSPDARVYTALLLQSLHYKDIKSSGLTPFFTKEKDDFESFYITYILDGKQAIKEEKIFRKAINMTLMKADDAYIPIISRDQHENLSRLDGEISDLWQDYAYSKIPLPEGTSQEVMIKEINQFQSTATNESGFIDLTVDYLVSLRNRLRNGFYFYDNNDSYKEFFCKVLTGVLLPEELKVELNYKNILLWSEVNTEFCKNQNNLSFCKGCPFLKKD